MRATFLLIISILALLAAQWWMAGRHDGAIFRGELHDSDSFMRLVRVANLIDGRDWYDHSIARANAPHGHTLHWSRPLDVLLLAGAAGLAPSMGWQDGLHLAGVWLSPLLHLLTLLALLWAARPLLPPSGLLWLGLLFPLQLFLDFQFAPGRPDHHALILLLMVCALGIQIRALIDRRTVWAALLVLPLGLMVWVSVEGLLAAALAFAIYLFCWIRQGRPWARHGLVLAAGLAAMSILAVVAEHPSIDTFTPHLDVISIVYIVLFMLVMSAFAVATFIRPLWPGLIAFAAVPVIQLLIFPDFIGGPLAAQDPKFAAAIFAYAGETAPVGSIRGFLLYFGPALLALPHGLWRLTQARDRRPWALITSGLVLYLPLAMLQVRWAPYVALLALPGYCAVLTTILAKIGGKVGMVRIFGAAIGQTAVVLIFAFGFLLLTAQFPNNQQVGVKCPQNAMARYLAARFPQKQRILSYMTIAPAILYRGPHEVIATPYFRNAQGGRDTLNFFRAMEVETAFEIAERRNIDLVLTCPADRESRLYRPDRPRPVWLQPVPLPPELAQWYRL
ncbi:MAG: hypothetical protein HOK30_07120, partial [Rhodospirillaceae bacterium]|nr:hypothetical protein [Rhodospirillaceae bacterium]